MTNPEPSPPFDVDVELWLDQQPGSEGGVMLIATLRASGETSLDGFSIEEVVLYGEGDAWRAAPLEVRPLGSLATQYTARNGPQWPVGCLVAPQVRVRTTDGVHEVRLDDLRVQTAE